MVQEKPNFFLLLTDSFHLYTLKVLCLLKDLQVESVVEMYGTRHALFLPALGGSHLWAFKKLLSRGEATVATFYCSLTLEDTPTARTHKFCFLLHSARVNLVYCQKYVSVKNKILTK